LLLSSDTHTSLLDNPMKLLFLSPHPYSVEIGCLKLSGIEFPLVFVLRSILLSYFCIFQYTFLESF
jgi:hypothetical protein